MNSNLFNNDHISATSKMMKICDMTTEGSDNITTKLQNYAIRYQIC